MGAVLARLGLSRRAAVFELSSRGALCRYLLRTFARVTFSELWDDVAPGDFRGVVQCQDVQQLTYPDASFDLVTSTEVFEHVPDDRRAFAEVFRVLRPGGRLVFTVPLILSILRPMNQLAPTRVNTTDSDPKNTVTPRPTSSQKRECVIASGGVGCMACCP